MPAENWERIKQVFTEALALPAERRDAYLHQACADRPGLREAVAELLAAHYDASTSFLEPGALLFDAPWLFKPSDQVAGRFTVVRPIARGAMGEVYEATDERLRLRVALKAIRPQLVGDAPTAERFRREVLVTRDIAHEGLCRVFDLVEHPIGPGFGLPEGTVVPCLTMQLLEGPSLEECLQHERPMSASAALPLLRQIADALDVLHDHGVVHRDLKPSNVMLVPDGDRRRAVLTDFGLAKPLDESLFETQTAVQGGAPFFMAPELFRGERPSRASDIYAFGLLIDEMVTRERAFSAESLHGLMMQKLQDGPARPSTRATGLPPAWEQTILRSLAADPRQRFQRARDACAGLEGRGTGFWRALTDRWRPFARLRRWSYAAMAGLAAVGFTGAFALKSPATGLAGQSVVVLPFKNLTDNPQNNYISTGTGGELSRRLSRIGGFVVYAPPSGASAIDPAHRPMFALTGYVQQAGDTLRITVQLTDGERGELIWSDNFESAGSKPLELEDTISTSAARALTRAAATRGQTGSVRGFLTSLGSWLGLNANPQIPRPGTANNAAFDAYMRGRYLFEERTLASGLTADRYLKEATTLDPSFAAPYATLADLQGLFMELNHGRADELLQQADDYATRAVTLDPNLPDAQLSLAAVRQMQSRWPEAEQAFRRSIQLHPAFARAYRWFGGMLLQFGRFDECLQLMDRALDLDPYDYPSQSAYGLALFYAGRPVDAARHLEQLLAKHDLLYAHVVLGQVYSYLAGQPGAQQETYLRRALEQSAILHDKQAESSRETAVATPLETEYADLVGALAWSFAKDDARATPFLRRLEAGRADRSISPSFAARVYAVQGRKDAALSALEDAASSRDREVMYLSVSPLYEDIRDEPRFRALEQRMRLVP